MEIGFKSSNLFHTELRLLILHLSSKSASVVHDTGAVNCKFGVVETVILKPRFSDSQALPTPLIISLVAILCVLVFSTASACFRLLYPKAVGYFESVSLNRLIEAIRKSFGLT